jgi:hypothetical protein
MNSRGIKQCFLATIVLSLLCALSLALAAPDPAPSAPRDWKAHPAVLEIQTNHEIYDVADLHGDYEKAIKLFVGAGLIKSAPAKPQDVQWNAGNNVLVCTGDMIDKWNQGLEILRFMRALEISAQKAGGQVLISWGNHEAEFLAANGSNNKAAEFEAELKKNGINPADVASGRDAEGIGQWLRERPAAIKVNDWFFCHAGNTGGMTLRELSDAVEKGVNKDGFGTFVLAEPNSILEARMSPVPWYVGPAASPGETPTSPGPDQPADGLARLQKNVAALGCKHLVIGHAPGKFRVDAQTERKAGQPFTYAGVIFFTDTGMSRGASDGHGTIFKIHSSGKESVTTLDETGASSELWTAKE